MKELSTSGLYEMEERDRNQMPCSPDKIRILYWALPNTLGKAELEEAAARILSFSQESGEWVGVNKSAILAQIQDERDMYRRGEKNHRKNLYRQQQYRKAMKKYDLFCFFTFGLWRRWKDKPEQPRVIDITEAPFTVVPIYGLQAISQGINLLLDKELLRAERGNFGERILFPTPLLIQRIMQAQQAQKTA